MSISSRTTNRLGVFAAALLFSTGGAAIKSSSLSSWQVAGFRSGIAAIVLWLLLPHARRGWTRSTGLVSLAYAATLILFVAANKLTTSANAIFLQSTAPFYLLALGPLILREPVRKPDIAVIIAVAAGAILLLIGSESAAATAPYPARGNLIGIVSGMTWAVTITGLRWLSRYTADSSTGSDRGTAAVIVGNLMALLICLPLAFPVVTISARDAAILLYLGTFQIGLAYALLTRSLHHVRALDAATLLLLEPVFNPIWTWIIHGERPGPLALAGGALIVLAAFAGTVWQARAHKPSPSVVCVK